MENQLIGKRIETRRKQLGFTLDDIAQEIGVARSTVQRYEKGNIEKIKLPVIEAIARVLSVNPAWLCCKSDSMFFSNSKPSLVELADNVESLAPMKKIPLIGQIACGTPILADENTTDYVDLPHHIQADYALTCKGDSMINAGIRDGDIVYIRHQEYVENGQIAAIRVDEDDATLKRFYYDGQTIQLVAENPAIPPKVFIGEEMNRIRIVGRAIAYIHMID